MLLRWCVHRQTDRQTDGHIILGCPCLLTCLWPYEWSPFINEIRFVGFDSITLLRKKIARKQQQHCKNSYLSWKYNTVDERWQNYKKSKMSLELLSQCKILKIGKTGEMRFWALSITTVVYKFTVFPMRSIWFWSTLIMATLDGGLSKRQAVNDLAAACLPTRLPYSSAFGPLSSSRVPSYTLERNRGED